MNNPINAIKQLLTKFSPQQAVINMLGSNTNPMIKNLVEMASVVMVVLVLMITMFYLVTLQHYKD